MGKKKKVVVSTKDKGPTEYKNICKNVVQIGTVKLNPGRKCPFEGLNDTNSKRLVMAVKCGLLKEV